MQTTGQAMKRDRNKEVSSRDPDAGDDWPPALAAVIKATVADVATQSVTDQKAYERLVAAGLTREQALGILQTIVASVNLA